MVPDALGEADPGLRIGVFGGTFDPPHIGHLIVAQDVADALELHQVLWVPAGTQPHKDSADVTPAADRLDLVNAATKGDDRFAVDDQEVQRLGPSYTVDTLRALHRAQPTAQLHLIVGADQFAEFDTWREPEEIGKLAVVAVMDRDGRRTTRGTREASVTSELVTVTRVDISSTAVRARVRSGRSVAYLVPDAVRRIIEDKRLYTRGP
jgi:nicotinate-nucleotide adenylyltransferase